MPGQGHRGRASDPIDEMQEYERTRTPLLSLESQTKLRDFDVISFSISCETDYVNLARMLQMSGVPVWAKDRTRHDPLIVMGGAASFLNPEPIAEFTDVIGVGEGEILGPKLIDVLLENDTKEKTPLALSRRRCSHRDEADRRASGKRGEGRSSVGVGATGPRLLCALVVSRQLQRRRHSCCLHSHQSRCSGARRPRGFG